MKKAKQNKHKLNIEPPNIDFLAHTEFEKWKNNLSLGNMPLSGIFEAFICQSRVSFARGYELGFKKGRES